MSVGVNVRMSKIMCIPTKVDVCTYATYVNSQALTKLDKRNTTTSRFDDDAILANCDITVFFPIYDQFAAVQNLYSGCMANTALILLL